jgi:hypothetical protein
MNAHIMHKMAQSSIAMNGRIPRLRQRNSQAMSFIGFLRMTKLVDEIQGIPIRGAAP